MLQQYAYAIQIANLKQNDEIQWQWKISFSLSEEDLLSSNE